MIKLDKMKFDAKNSTNNHTIKDIKRKKTNGPLFIIVTKTVFVFTVLYAFEVVDVSIASQFTNLNFFQLFGKF